MAESALRWRRRGSAGVELAVVVVVAVAVGGLGWWVADPVRSDPATGCVFHGSPLVRIELAVPDVEGEDETLATLDEVVRCIGEPEEVGSDLRTSTRRDVPFILAYGALLFWCAARHGGVRGRPRDGRESPPLAIIDGSHTVRLLGRIGAWCVAAAVVLDLIENGMLFWTADTLTAGDIPKDDRVDLTAGVAAAKFALLALPVLLGLNLVRELVTAMVGSRHTVPGQHDAAVPDAGDDHRRWSVPVARGAGGIMARYPLNTSSYGICFSGGGIRSATFALGAIQELEHRKHGRWAIQRARYVSAVSGGSYMAAAYQFLAQQGVGNADARPAPSGGRRPGHAPSTWPVVGRLVRAFHRPAGVGRAPGAAPAGPPGAVPAGPPRRTALVPPAGSVEHHLRRHASHLADGAAEWAQALAEVVKNAATGLFVLLLTIWVVAVPLGWVYRYGLHGVDDDGDPAFDLDLRILAGIGAAFLVLAAFRWIVARNLDRRADEQRPADAPPSADRGGQAKEHARAATAYAVLLIVVGAIVVPFVAPRAESAASTVGRWVGVADEPSGEPDRAAVNGHLQEVLAGAAAVAAVEATLDEPALRTPALAVSVRAARLAAATTNEAVAELAAAMDEDDDGRDDSAAMTPLAVRFDPTTCAPFEPEGDEAVPGADQAATVRACHAATAAAGAAAAIADVAEGSQAGVDEASAASLARAARSATTGAGTAAAAVRALGDELSGRAEDGPPESAPVAWAGLSALVAAIGGLVAKRRMDVAKGPAPAEAPRSTSKGDRVVRNLGFSGVVGVVALSVTAAVVVVACSDVVVDAWRRGLYSPLDIGFTQPAWRWWLTAVAGLLIGTVAANVDTWSLRPFYHRRLWLPYAVTPEGRTADWRVDTKLSVVGKQVPGHPQLIICAAVQTSGREWAPPGRRALPIVFTSLAIGGPEVGYVRTAALEKMLERDRRSISLFGAVATSGAAFGPAMGRHSKGGLGPVMAVANARLGAWLPNPRHVADLAAAADGGATLRAGSFARVPRLPYWFREIVGQYPIDGKLVLATDGGHVENLGLLELLRRRCTRILCFDASGAGATPTTLAEAIILAREELDVTITLETLPQDPEPVPPEPTARARLRLRPAGVEVTVPGKPPAPSTLLVMDEFDADPLRRRASKVANLAGRIAGRPVLVARIDYPPIPGAGPATGRLVYGTLALTGDAEDWDLLEYAHRNDVFPNDGTARQWFDASTFAAYQQLGRRTAARMVEEANAAEARAAKEAAKAKRADGGPAPAPAAGSPPAPAPPPVT